MVSPIRRKFEPQGRYYSEIDTINHGKTLVMRYHVVIQAVWSEDTSSCIMNYLLRGSLHPFALILRTLSHSFCSSSVLINLLNSSIPLHSHVTPLIIKWYALCNAVEDLWYGYLKLGCGRGGNMDDDIRVLWSERCWCGYDGCVVIGNCYAVQKNGKKWQKVRTLH